MASKWHVRIRKGEEPFVLPDPGLDSDQGQTSIRVCTALLLRMIEGLIAPLFLVLRLDFDQV